MGLSDLAALVTIMVWPVVPLFWIPVHGLPGLVRKLGLLSYAIPVITWVPVACLLYSFRGFLLGWKLDLPFVIALLGWTALAAGVGLQAWTGRLLGIRGLLGLPEIRPAESPGPLVARGVFGVVRHPTYLSHSLMFAGVFLITGVGSLGVITLFDAAVINLVVIPLEERELSLRFGPGYEAYRRRVPAFFPALFRRRG
jgi:protein-S-isoprenylcysteine O-methyltransferase Ste14